MNVKHGQPAKLRPLDVPPSQKHPNSTGREGDRERGRGLPRFTQPVPAIRQRGNRYRLPASAIKSLSFLVSGR